MIVFILLNIYPNPILWTRSEQTSSLFTESVGIHISWVTLSTILLTFSFIYSFLEQPLEEKTELEKGMEALQEFEQHF